MIIIRVIKKYPILFYPPNNMTIILTKITIFSLIFISIINGFYTPCPDTLLEDQCCVFSVINNEGLVMNGRQTYHKCN